MHWAFRGATLRKLLEITTGRHPFQVAIVAACPLASLAIIVSGNHPPSLDAALPPPLADVWLYALALGGIGAQVGAYWPGELDNGLILEFGGVALLGSMLTIYASSLILVQGGQAIGAASFLLSIAVAGWWRAGQILRDVRKVWRAQQEGLTATVRVLIGPEHPDDSPAGPGAP